jgi:cytochrome c peroxidase
MKKTVFILTILFLIFSCKKDVELSESSYQEIDYNPTPYNLKYPSTFPIPLIDMELTVEGVALGKKLFNDPILSRDNTISCASCHVVEKAFSDGNKTAIGIQGRVGPRNSMPLFNLAWSPTFFWDGRSPNLIDQVLHPIRDPLEMDFKWIEILKRLQNHDEYPKLFLKAFGIVNFDSMHVAEAIAMFELSLISGDSKFDKFLRGETVLSINEQKGLGIFMKEPRLGGGDCFHCHGSPANPLFSFFGFENNGLDDKPNPGLYLVTRNPADIGKFKVPSMRNLSFTAPYMHDGRFNTLEEVVDFYTSGVKISPTLSVLMNKDGGLAEGLTLSKQDKKDLIDFLKTLDDYTFVQGK